MVDEMPSAASDPAIPTTVEGVVALLVSQLRRAYIEPQPDQDACLSSHLRGQHCMALTYIAQFLHGFAAEKEIVDQLTTLSMALYDLELGVAHPMFRPKKERGRPKDSSAVWRARTTAAQGMYCLIKAGHTRDSAARMAVKKYPSLEKLHRLWEGRGKMTPGDTRNSLLRWHDDLSAGLVLNELASEAYSETPLIDEFSNLLSLDERQLEQCGLNLLGRAVELVKYVGY